MTYDIFSKMKHTVYAKCLFTLKMVSDATVKKVTAYVIYEENTHCITKDNEPIHILS
jgi:hypothetical protein